MEFIRVVRLWAYIHADDLKTSISVAAPCPSCAAV
jgi:hypothetical protein